jgi:hypothetical protein
MILQIACGLGDVSFLAAIVETAAPVNKPEAFNCKSRERSALIHSFKKQKTADRHYSRPSGFENVDSPLFCITTPHK